MKEQDIQWAVDELEIRNVIASLALLSDMGDIDEWGMLFTEDADYTTQSGAGWHGRAEIVESGRQRRARGTHGPGSNNRHLSASVLVRSTGPDAAEAESYLAMYKDLVPDGDQPGNDGAEKSPTLLVLGYYRDRFVRTKDGWKVAHRDLVQTSSTPQWRAIMQSWSG
ncbi:MAG: nuclear transport factor 2 family protein [Acidimicrobiaceae bacterium]|nr:nuclear transport factor 2 family protein [Acidimicrobiaceae bacterium]